VARFDRVMRCVRKATMKWSTGVQKERSGAYALEKTSGFHKDIGRISRHDNVP
jgi:hypothetical protein